MTPFSPPAMARALHAILVIAGRHIAEWQRPSDFDAGAPKFVSFLEFLRQRVADVDPDHLADFDDYLKDKLDFWQQNRPDKWGILGGNRDEPTLMRIAGTEATEDDMHSLATPTSLRNVDIECSARVIPRYPADKEATL